MPVKMDTGVCRCCHRRKNLNKYGLVVHHKYQRRPCDGIHTRPADGSIIYDGKVESGKYPQARNPTLQQRIDKLEQDIENGVIKTANDLQRARNTLKQFRERLETLPVVV